MKIDMYNSATSIDYGVIIFTSREAETYIYNLVTGIVASAL